MFHVSIWNPNGHPQVAFRFGHCLVEGNCCISWKNLIQASGQERQVIERKHHVLQLFVLLQVYTAYRISSFRFSACLQCSHDQLKNHPFFDSNAEKAPLACQAPNPHLASALPRPNQVYDPGPEPLRTSPFPICHPYDVLSKCMEEKLTQLNIIPMATEWKTNWFVNLKCWNWWIKNHHIIFHQSWIMCLLFCQKEVREACLCPSQVWISRNQNSEKRENHQKGNR